MHASAPARQRAHSGFRATASAPTSSRRPTTPDERLHHVGVGLAGVSTAYLRGGWDDRAERCAIGAAATAAERGAQAVVAERGRVARGSRCARKRALAAHHAQAQTASGEGHRRTAWPRGGHGSRFALRCANLWSGTRHQRNAKRRNALRCCVAQIFGVEWPLVERDRARVDATIVCESCLVRGRRSGSRPPASSHDVGGLWGVCGDPPTRASACGVGWGGGMGRRVGGEGYVVPLGSTPLPHHAAPVCHPVPLRRVLSRALRHRLPIATSCSLAYVPPVWSCRCRAGR